VRNVSEVLSRKISRCAGTCRNRIDQLFGSGVAGNESLTTQIHQRIPVISSLYVCMAIKYIIVLFVETPRKFITAKLSIRKPGSSSVLIICHQHIISTDEDPGLESQLDSHYVKIYFRQA
jgi:hypothetical protein